MANDLMNTKGFQGRGPAAIFQQTPHPQESLADGIGQSYPIIGYKGKVWSLRYRGERKVVVRPDDGSPASYLDVIILRSADHKAKSFYPSYDPNTDGEQPLCSSMDGNVPDRNVRQQQAEACALCPRNEWKTQPNGKKGRECADYKRLAVLMMPQVSQALFGEPLMEGAFLRVPPASLQALAMMGEQMDAQGYPYYSYVTRITFDPNEAHPKMLFKAERSLNDDEGKVILAMREEAGCKRIVDGETSHGLRAVTAPVTPQQITASPSTFDANIATPAQQSPQPSVSSASARPVIDAMPLTESNGHTPGPSPSIIAATTNVVSTPLPPATPSNKSGNAAAPSATTFGLAQATPAAVPGSNPAAAFSQAQADTGEPSFADAELDARIAKLLPPQ